MIGNKRYFRYLFVFVLGVGLLGSCGNKPDEKSDGCKNFTGKKITDWSELYQQYNTLNNSIVTLTDKIDNESDITNVKFPKPEEICQPLQNLQATAENDYKEIKNIAKNIETHLITEPINKLNPKDRNNKLTQIESTIPKTQQDQFGKASDEKKIISNYLQYNLFKLKLEIYKKISKDEEKLTAYFDEKKQENDERNQGQNQKEAPAENSSSTKKDNPIGLLITMFIIGVGAGAVGAFFIIQKINQKEEKPANNTGGNGNMNPLTTQSQNTEIQNLRNELYAQLNKSLDDMVASKVQEIKGEIQESTNSNKLQQITSLESRILDLEDELKQLKQLKQNYSPALTTNNPDSTEPNSPHILEPPAETLPALLPASTNITEVNTIVNIYNQNPVNLPSDIEVSEIKETIENRRLGHSQQPVLQKVRRNQGNYLIINVYRTDLLVPKINLKVTEYVFSTLNILFDCDNYSDDYTKFTLIKPAEVTKLGENWELKEKGKLEFE